MKGNQLREDDNYYTKLCITWVSTLAYSQVNIYHPFFVNGLQISLQSLGRKVIGWLLASREMNCATNKKTCASWANLYPWWKYEVVDD